MNDNFLWCCGSNIYLGYHILLLMVSGLLYPQLRCIKYSACFVFCLFYFILTDNKLFENADTAKSRVVQLEIQVAQIQQVTTPDAFLFFKLIGSFTLPNAKRLIYFDFIFNEWVAFYLIEYQNSVSGT